MADDVPQIQGFSVEVGRRQADQVDVVVAGEVDLYSAPLLKERVLGLAADGVTRVSLDLSNVTFIDSTGLGVVVSSLKRLREAGGELRLVRPSPATFKVLEITGLHKLIPIDQ